MCIGRFLAQRELKQKGGNFGEAEKLLKRALEIDGASATAHAALGEIRLHQAEPSQAKAHFKLATQADPTNSTVRRLGDQLKRRRSFKAS